MNQPGDGEVPLLNVVHRGKLAPVWRTVRRGLLCVSISLPSLCAVPIGCIPCIVFGDDGPILFLIALGMVVLLYSVGTIQCAMAPDPQARGFMLGAVLQVGLHVMLGFAQVAGLRMPLPGTRIDLLAHWAAAIHAVIASAGFLLHLLFVRRLGQIFDDPLLARDARLVILSFLAWLAAVAGLIITNVVMDRIAFEDRRGVLMAMNVVGFVGSLVAGMAFVSWFCIVLGNAHKTICHATARRTARITFEVDHLE